ncbi:MAG: hypothetical protein HQL71_03765, partial [Magnetococcales bacterium]|nr:hypothetical protein [Magnetococcales bacterium]
MANFMASAGFLFFLVLSLYGWGFFVLRKLLPNNSFGWAYHATFGMAFWIFLGGILNFLAIAKPQALWSIMLFGLILSLFYLYKPTAKFLSQALCTLKATSFSKLQVNPNFLGYCILYFGISALIIFYICTIMPTDVFTPSDDFWTYLARPLQMLGGGSLENGSIFTAMPIDSLGGQAYMQAFFYVVLGYEHIFGFDVILCFFLSIFMVIELSKKLNIPL